MLLAVDIGNTNITLGVYENEKLIHTCRLATDVQRTEYQYAAELMIIFSLNKISRENIDGAIISSVVPELTNIFYEAIESVTGLKAIILGPGVKTGLKIVTDCHSQVGADLVAVSVGAIAKYPLPCIIVDLGTATKIILIDESATFRGCTISAGVRISLKALAEKTSLLPSIDIKTPDVTIGTNTLDCMLSGTVFGTAAMIDGLTSRIEKEFGQKAASVVATGGYSKEIVKNCCREIKYDKNLILDGLKSIYNKNK